MAKRLLIDIGNTRIKWFLLDLLDGQVGESIKGTVIEGAENRNVAKISAVKPCFAFAHENDFDPAVVACFTELDVDEGSTFDIFVSNVAGQCARQALCNFFELNWQCTPYFISVKRDAVQIKNRYNNLSELGVDRWVAVIGARQLYKKSIDSKKDKPIIVINCGTAITVDLLSADNVFEGGVILPGFDLVSNALSKANGITHFEPVNINSPYGRTTQDCVRVGVLSACVGGVEKVVADICSSLKVSERDQMTILVSGGAAQLFLNATVLDCDYDPNIIIRGLNRLAECEF